MSDELLVKETLDLRAIIGILGERPFAPKSNYKAYLEVKQEDEIEKPAAEAEKETEPSESAAEKKPEPQQVNS